MFLKIWIRKWSYNRHQLNDFRIFKHNIYILKVNLSITIFYNLKKMAMWQQSNVCTLHITIYIKFSLELIQNWEQCVHWLKQKLCEPKVGRRFSKLHFIIIIFVLKETRLVFRKSITVKKDYSHSQCSQIILPPMIVFISGLYVVTQGNCN